MQIFITDFTEMGAGNYCVAGWNAETASMVRPLPNGGNWSTALATQHQIAPGCIVELTETGHPHNGDFPHSTEDTRVTVEAIVNQGAHPGGWSGASAPHKAVSVQEAFEGNVAWNKDFRGRKQGVHVPKGTATRSLWGLSILSDQMRFVEEFDKLKAVIHDNEDEYIVSVSGTMLKSLFRDGGADAVNAAIPAHTLIHARLGLARGFGTNPNKCFMMLNGVHF